MQLITPITLYLLFFFGLPQILAGQSLSAMSFNIRYDNPKDGENAWDKRKEELVQLLHYYHPDFIGTQEGLKHQLDFITKGLPSYKMIGVGREDGKEKGEYTAIFYHAEYYELQQQQTFWLSESEEVGSVGWDAALERICTYGTFNNKQTGVTYHVFNTHFDHRGQKAREMSAQLILKKIAALTDDSDKVILMGDFNSLPDSAPIKAFSANLKDGYTATQSPFYGPDGTFNSFDPNQLMDRRIDYVFVQNLDVLKCRHIDDKRKDNYFISDHLPVLVELKD